MYRHRYKPTSSTTHSSVTKTLQLYNPLPTQLRVHQSNKRFNIVCFGRQSGKTTYGLNKIADAAWRGPKNGIYWYILQTYDAAHVAFKRMYQFYRSCPEAFDKKPNESDLACRFIHGPEISFKSGKNYQDLRIETLDGCVIDEYRQQPKELWTMVIRPMLGAKKGWCDILSTSNGFDHFKDLFDFALTQPDEWGVFQAASTEAPWWTPQEIASARALMSEDEFAQEILAEFREMGAGKAYKNHGTWNHASINPFCSYQTYSPHLPIVVGLDFNVGLMVWQLGQVAGTDFYFADEIAVENTNSEECAKVLVEKVKDHKEGVVLIGDASGNANKTSAVGKTDYSIITRILKEAGIKYRNLTPDSNPHVKDRVNCVNGRLKAADGSVHLWYNPLKCKYLKRDFERVKWKSGTEGAMFDKKDPLVTHASDAMGYPVAHYSDLLKKSVGTLKIIGV